jgi:hypothetical protein
MGLLDSIKDALRGKGVASNLSTPKSTPATDEALAQYATDLNLQNLLVLGSDFKPDDIIDLRRRARYGDPRWLYSLYDEMNRLGPAPQISKMRMALKNTDSIWKATPEDYDDDEEQATEAKASRLIRDVCEEAWGKWLPTLKSHHSTKHLYGIQAMQIIVEPRGVADRWERVIDVRPIPARRFRLDPMTRKFLFLPQPTSWTGVPVEDLIEKGQMFWAEVGKDVEPLDQRGLLFQCLIPWAIHQYIVRWRAKRMELYGIPPRLVTYKPGSPEGKKVAEEVAQMLGAVSWAAIPDTMKAELLQIPTGRGIDPYEAAIEWAVRTYDQLILGHSQASGVQVGAGSRTSTETASEMAKDLINARAAEFDDDFSTGPLALYVKRNFGDEWAKSSTPTITSRMIERDDATMLSAVAVNLQKAGIAGEIDGLDVITRCGFEIAGDGDVTLAGNIKGEEPQPGAMPPGMMPPGMQPGMQPPGQAALPPGGQPGTQPKALPPAGGGGSPAQQPAANQPPPPKEVAGKQPGNTKQPAAANAKMGAPLGANGQPAASTLRRKKKARSFTTLVERRQRFSEAVSQTRPRVHITTFGYAHGAPNDQDALIDVRSLSSPDGAAERTGLDPAIKKSLDDHPRTGVVMGGVKTAALRAISAAQLTGAPEVRLGVGCEHGRHRSVYAAERLKADLIADGHDVTLNHRDAYREESLKERLPGPAVEQEYGVVIDATERFYSEDQPRDHAGRWVGGGTEMGHRAERAASPGEHELASRHHHDAAGLLFRKAATSGDAHFEKVALAHAHAGVLHGMASRGEPGKAAEARRASRGAHAVTHRLLAGKFAADSTQVFEEDEHPRWPAGSEEGRGGEFAPKDAAGGAGHSHRETGGERGNWTTTEGVGYRGREVRPMEEAPSADPFPEANVAWDQPVDDAGRPVPIRVDSVEAAIPLVLDGKVVELPDVKGAATLIEKLGQIANEAKAAGREARDYNLCNVTVANTNLFCAETLNHDRITMPQLAGVPVPGSEASKLPFTPGTKEVDGGTAFVRFLKDAGYEVSYDRVLAANLKATQNELIGLKVGGIMGSAAKGNRAIIDTPIFVTKDNYVVDGHHRWAAVVGLDTADGRFNTKMNIIRINAGITEVLHLANNWSRHFGIKQSAGVQKGKHGARGGQQFMAEHNRAATYHRDKAEAFRALGDHTAAGLHEKAAAAHEVAAVVQDGPEEARARAVELAHATSALAFAVPDAVPRRFAHMPKKPARFKGAEAQLAARVRARLKAQHEIATTMIEEKLKPKTGEAV